MQTYLLLLPLSLLSVVGIAEANRRGHGGDDRHRGRWGPEQVFGGGVDWYAASGPNDPCTGPTSSSTPIAATTSTTTTAAATAGQPTSGKLFSLSEVTVCDEAATGASKCICVRGRPFFRSTYNLKCGTCQLTFVPTATNGGNTEFGALVNLEGSEEGKQAEEEFGSTKFQ